MATAGQASLCFGGLSIPPLASYLTGEFSLSKTEYGSIMSILYLGASFSSFPSGRLSDIFGVKIYLSISLIGMGLCVAAIFLAKSYFYLLLISFFIGLGYGTANPATNRAIMMWFSRNTRGTAMSIKQSSVPIGGFLAALIMAPLAIYLGWRYAFLIGGLGIMFSSIFPLIFYKSFPVHPTVLSSSISSRTNKLSFKKLFTNKDLILISFIAAIFASVQIAIGTYLVLYLEEVALFSLAVAAAFLGLANAGGIVGRICWGIISDRLLGGRRRIVLQIVACISGLSALLISLYAYINTYINAGKWFLVPIVFILGFTSIGWNGIYHAYLVEIAGKSLAGTATGISLSVVFLGNVIGPLIFGLIVDLSGEYRYAWQFIVMLMSFSLIVLFLLKETVSNAKQGAT